MGTTAVGVVQRLDLEPSIAVLLDRAEVSVRRATAAAVRACVAAPISVRASTSGTQVEVGNRSAFEHLSGVGRRHLQRLAPDRHSRRRAPRTPSGSRRRRTAARSATGRSRPSPGRAARARRTRRSASDRRDRFAATWIAGRREPRSAICTRSATGRPTLVATSPAYSLRTFAFGCSLTTAIASSARRARCSGDSVGRDATSAADRNPRNGIGVVDGRLERLRVTLGEVARVLARGQLGDRHLDLVGLLPLVEPRGGALAGGIGVEGQHDLARVALEQADVFLGERRAAGGDRTRRRRRGGTRSRRCSPRTRSPGRAWRCRPSPS